LFHGSDIFVSGSRGELSEIGEAKVSIDRPDKAVLILSDKWQNMLYQNIWQQIAQRWGFLQRGFGEEIIS
jgi:hypothetical protein